MVDEISKEQSAINNNQSAPSFPGAGLLHHEDFIADC
jgi:hypothetical protein